MHRNKSVDTHRFAMIPKADIPRSTFNIQHSHKTTFDAGLLIPVYIQEVLPGDSISCHMTAFCRMSTPLFPTMDNLYLDSFFFFVPNRLTWKNWVRFMGEQDNPGDSVSFLVPQKVCPPGGYAIGSMGDYLGLPTVGQMGAGATYSHSALPLRCYALCWNEWFRDENLQTAMVVSKDDGPDITTDVVLRRRGKRHDYFTGALPWPQKGQSVQLPLGTQAPVHSDGSNIQMRAAGGGMFGLYPSAATTSANVLTAQASGNTGVFNWGPVGAATTGLFADLTAATAATINQLRQAFQIQKLLERDARGGTRYTEIIRAHFGVVSPDARLQRPEYLGGGSTPIIINPVAQQSATGAYANTPLGTLGGIGTTVAQNGFSQSFTEHGHILGLVSVRADLTYQQGVRKMWNRETKYDFYFPAFAMLGEQAILNRELYADGSAADDEVFGYQERWADYRYTPSQVSGLFKSTAAGSIDGWHLAQKFAALPTLNATFIEDRPPVDRVIAVGATANGQQFLFDSVFSSKFTRALPMYSVPGLIDHF